MRSLSKVFGCRLAVVVAVLASACQHDSNAIFDDGALRSSSGNTGTAGAGMEQGASGATDEAGAPSGGGELPATGGGAGVPGEPPTAGNSGTAGQSMGGSGALAGSGPSGGSAGNAGGPPVAGAGMGGKPPIPDPITIEITEIEDTTIAFCTPNENFSSDPTLQVDGDYCLTEALLRPVLTSIPAAAEVSQATLALHCTNAGGAVTVRYVNESWKANTVRYNNQRPMPGEVIGVVSCAKVGDVVDVDLTSPVSAWLSGTAQPYGIYLTTQDSDGTDFASSEAQKAEQRPVLRVTYTLGK